MTRWGKRYHFRVEGKITRVTYLLVPKLKTLEQVCSIFERLNLFQTAENCGAFALGTVYSPLLYTINSFQHGSGFFHKNFKRTHENTGIGLAVNNRIYGTKACVLLFLLLSIVGTSFVYSAAANPVPAAEPDSLSNLWLGTWIAGVAATAVTLGAAIAFSYLTKTKRRRQRHI
jgi:hypothetical protein